jgi:hypothetical protein
MEIPHEGVLAILDISKGMYLLKGDEKTTTATVNRHQAHIAEKDYLVFNCLSSDYPMKLIYLTKIRFA